MKSYENAWKKVGSYIFLLIVLVWVIFPLFWAATNSIKPRLSTFEPGALLPFLQYRPTIDRWFHILSPHAENPLGALFNSLVVSSGSTLIVLFVSTMAAYALARYQFGRIKSKDLALFFLSQRVMPPAVVLVPFFIIMLNLNLLDTKIGLVLVYTTFNLPYGILIMWSVFKEIPAAIEEAAFVDGASDMQVLWQISLPLARNGLIASAIIVFAFAWVEGLFALTLTEDVAKTLPLYIMSARSHQGTDFAAVGVNTCIALIIPIILSVLIQKHLARGLTFGAVKG